jgi:peptide-methionine (R)-S-oxide reductase
MEPRDRALLHARLRIGLGAAFVLFPGLAGRFWIGSDAARRPVKVLARAFGARDLAIGLGVVIALDRGAPVRGWIEAGALSDAIDTCASLLAGNSIHPAIRWPAIALGATSAAAGGQLAPEFAHAPDSIPGQTPEAVLTGHPPEGD